MKKIAELGTPVKKPKFYVKEHHLENEQVLIEFRRWPEDLIPRFTSTVHKSQVEAEMQKFQESVKGNEARQEEIARRLYGKG